MTEATQRWTVGGARVTSGTHLLDGRWVPTFARARHIYVGAELEAQAQCAEPAVAFVSDADGVLAAATRKKALAAAVDADALVLGTHFPSLPGGRVVADGAAWRFVPQPGSP